MAAAQAGDGAVYAALLAALLPHLRRTARARWPQARPVDLEDAVQEALIAIHEARHLYDPARPLLPFVNAILRFRGADALRRGRRRARLETPIDDLDETSSALATKETQDVALDAAAVRRALSTLPPGQRQALEMTKIAEMSLAEASAASGLSVTALKVATHRAVKALRRMMKEGG